MISIRDLFAVWDRLTPVRRLRELAERMRAIEERLDRLERTAPGAETPPPRKCRVCGHEGGMVMISSGVNGGRVVETWECTACKSPRHVIVSR